MSAPELQIKELIANRWDLASESFDMHIGHGIQSEKERDAWKRMFREVFPGKGLKILDVGCGTGEIGLLFAELGHHVTGLDLSDKMIAKAREKASKKGLDLTFKKGDAEAPPFEPETFDVVVNRHLLWTLPHPDKAVRSWRNLLKKDGMLIVVDGLWNDGSLETRLRRFISDFCILLIERKNPRKGHYTSEINRELPNPFGAPPEKTLGYFREAGFKNAKDVDLKELIEIQKKTMSFRKQIVFNYKYHLIYGKK